MDGNFTQPENEGILRTGNEGNQASLNDSNSLTNTTDDMQPQLLTQSIKSSSYFSSIFYLIPSILLLATGIVIALTDQRRRY